MTKAGRWPAFCLAPPVSVTCGAHCVRLLRGQAQEGSVTRALTSRHFPSYGPYPRIGAPRRFARTRYVTVELAGRPHTSADSLTPGEESGLRLFIGKANCTTCHNGARLTDDHFHNTGVSASSLGAGVDSGRTTGVRQVVAGEFNCLSRYSDAKPEDCSELRFAVTEGDELVRAFKTPSLRNIAARAPFMHAGQLSTLRDVIEHYDRAPRAPFGKSELKRLKLSAIERRQIEAFLQTLSAPPGRR